MGISNVEKNARNIASRAYQAMHGFRQTILFCMVYCFLSVLREKIEQRIAFDLLEGADLNFSDLSNQN